jgi:para-aminobenzoate synthetase component 1
VASGLRDVTSDLAALDSTGFWAVSISFEGQATCARFDRVGRAAVPPARWSGVAGPWSSSLDEDLYRKGVGMVREAIAAGDVYQVNLCRVLSAPIENDADIAGLHAALAARNPAPHAALLRLPGLQVASASPERFLRRQGDMVESQPIKGTVAPGQPFPSKDTAENVMIVDLVRNDLGRVCEPGTIHVPALCRRERHPGLDHLVSTVRGRLRARTTWAELLGAAFPPGSVTGAPKLAALDMIRDLEPTPRGPYCGALGWVDADRKTADLNVAIRTFWIEDGRLHLGTGAGVTWGSTPHGEWAETELKARRLLEVAASAT